MADISAIKLPNNNTYNIKDNRIAATDITNWNGKAAGDHVHGDLTNAGDITASATIASGDRLVINDESASKITNSSITFGDSTTTFLANNGTWQTPQGSGSDALNVSFYYNRNTERIDSATHTYDEIKEAIQSNTPIVATLNNYYFDEVLPATSIQLLSPDNECDFFFDTASESISLTVEGGEPDVYSLLATTKTAGANKIYAGPTSGSASSPSFRNLVAADIPELSASKITSGQLAVANGGTGAATLDGAGIVTKTDAQTISGAKTFTGTPIIADQTYYPGIKFSGKNTSTDVSGWIWLNMTATNNVYRTDKFTLAEYSYNGTTGAALNTFEGYKLPSVDANLAASINYEILTTKSVVTVAQGGTGAASLDSAGIVTKTDEQTISSIKTFTAYPIIKATSAGNMPSILFRSSVTSDNDAARIGIQTNSSNGYHTYFGVRVYGRSSSTYAPLTTYEAYRLPVSTPDLSENASYEIVTTKSGSLTTDQAANARSNLGIGNVGTLTYGSDTTTFLRNDGTWAVPSGGTGGGDVTTTGNQTISGYKYLNQPSVYNSSTGNASLWFYPSSSGGTASGSTGIIVATTQTVNSLKVMDHFTLGQYSYNASTGAALSYRENYVLPTVEAGLSSNKTYEIMTEKNIGTWMAANYPDADTSSY